MGFNDQPVATKQGGGEISVDPTDLHRVGARPGPFRYLKQLWDFRSFILYDSRSRISGNSSDDALGRFWLVLNPILNGAAYFFVFGVLLQTGRGIENFVAYLIIGVFMFRFTTSSITSGARSITGNRSVIQAFNFPRATLPIAVNVRELMRQVPVYITMFALILLIPPLEPLSWKWLLIVPVVVLQFLFNLGITLLLARLVTRWNDVTHLITFGTRIWLYLSCVFFSPERFAGNDVLINAMHMNPMFCILDITRDAILYDTLPDVSRWIVLGSWTLAGLIVGYIVFWQAEESYGRER